MAGGPIKLRVDVDMNALIQEAKRAGASLDDLTDAFNDVSTGSKDAGKDAETSLKKIDKSGKNATDSVDKVGKKSKDTTGKLSQLGSTAKQALSGDLAGAADDAGGALEELSSSMTGVGAAAAGVAALAVAAIGAVLSNAADAEAKLEEARQKAVSLAQTMYQDGGTIPLTDRVQDLITLLGSERSPTGPFENIANQYLDLGTGLDLVRRAAKAAKSPVEDFIAGLTGGDLDTTKRTLQKVNEEIAKTTNEAASGKTGLLDKEWAARRTALKEFKDELTKVIGAQKLADELYNSTDFLNAQKIEDHNAEVEKVGATWDANKLKVEGYIAAGERGVKMPKFDVAQFLSDWGEQTAAVDALKKELLELPQGIRDQAFKTYEESGAQAAQIFVDGYKTASPAQQKQLESILSAQGQAAGKKAGEAITDAADGILGNWTPTVLNPVTLKVHVDKSEWDNWTPAHKQIFLDTRVGTATGGRLPK